MQIQNLLNFRGSHLDDERKFKCHCGKAFKRNSDLNRHTQIHDANRPKPFVCEVKGCGKRFAQRSALRTHTNTHTGAKPYTCEVPECGRCFADSSSLARHRFVHWGKCPYRCDQPGCQRGYISKELLEWHRKNQHESLCPTASCHSVGTASSASMVMDTIKPVPAAVRPAETVATLPPLSASPTSASPQLAVMPPTAAPPHTAYGSPPPLPMVSGACIDHASAAFHAFSQHYAMSRAAMLSRPPTQVTTGAAAGGEWAPAVSTPAAQFPHGVVPGRHVPAVAAPTWPAAPHPAHPYSTLASAQSLDHHTFYTTSASPLSVPSGGISVGSSSPESPLMQLPAAPPKPLSKTSLAFLLSHNRAEVPRLCSYTDVATPAEAAEEDGQRPSRHYNYASNSYTQEVGSAYSHVRPRSLQIQRHRWLSQGALRHFPY